MATRYRTVPGQLYTRAELRTRTLTDALAGWDEAIQGPFAFNFDDWLIDAVNSGVIEVVNL